jgi:N-acetylglucosaminyldiphosphoundecaprenol N-acetyl-beta-D-mannosaminyltransferase
MARAGLEWLHRLAHEPRRMWRRYLVDDVAFLPIVARELALRRREARG